MKKLFLCYSKNRLNRTFSVPFDHFSICIGKNVLFKRKTLINIILLIDNCSAHPNINEFLTNIKLVFLPPNTTSILQPMDSGVILNFKDNYRKLLVMEMIRCCNLNLDFKINVFQAIQMIEDSWRKNYYKLL